MQIAGIQKTTLVDYPGKIAATVFLRGCNFRCGFCHNPEIVVPEQFGELISMSDLFNFLESRVGKIEGVCITGGEPLLWNTTRELISHIKALGFAVKLDTNGAYPERLLEIFKDGDIDYVAMDIKAPFPSYKLVTKSEDSKLEANVERSIELIMSSGVDYEFRTTVAKPFHHPDDFIKIGQMICGAKKYYIQNFVKSKHINELEKFEPFNKDELDLALKNISSSVCYTAIR